MVDVYWYCSKTNLLGPLSPSKQTKTTLSHKQNKLTFSPTPLISHQNKTNRQLTRCRSSDVLPRDQKHFLQAQFSKLCAWLKDRNKNLAKNLKSFSLYRALYFPPYIYSQASLSQTFSTLPSSKLTASFLPPYHHQKYHQTKISQFFLPRAAQFFSPIRSIYALLPAIHLR